MQYIFFGIVDFGYFVLCGYCWAVFLGFIYCWIFLAIGFLIARFYLAPIVVWAVVIWTVVIWVVFLLYIFLVVIMSGEKSIVPLNGKN